MTNGLTRYEMLGLAGVSERPLSSYVVNQFYGIQGRTMVHNTEQAFVSMPLPNARGKTQNTAWGYFPGTSLALALRGAGSLGVVLTGFIAYGKQLFATGGSGAMG